MVCFALGITTRAFFQKSASVARASGSVSIARRTRASLKERTRFQLLPILADVLPVRFSLMSLCPPGRNDSPPAMGYVSVGHRNLDAVYHSHSVNAHLAVIETFVHLFQSGPFEYLDGVLERNAVTGNVPAILLGVPNVVPAVIFTLCLYESKSARAVARCKLAVPICCGFINSAENPTALLFEPSCQD